MYTAIMYSLLGAMSFLWNLETDFIQNSIKPKWMIQVPSNKRKLTSNKHCEQSLLIFLSGSRYFLKATNK